MAVEWQLSYFSALKRLLIFQVIFGIIKDRKDKEVNHEDF